MKGSRLFRQQVLQLLCQFDAGNEEVVHITNATFDEELSPTIEPQSKTLQLAKEIWEDRLTADAEIESLTPQWPIHRQPLIDRNILRLARYEIVTGMTPAKVSIDEAIELARLFSTERSVSFVNGVLDTLFKNINSSSSEGEDS